MDHAHGGDILTAQSRFSGKILDFSANLNPLGMPASVQTAAEAAVGEAIHYPDPFCRNLRRGLAVRDGVEEGQIICGNGAADLIFRLSYALRPQKALVTAPTFSEYEQALRAVDCGVAYHLLREENDFALTEAVLQDLTGELDMAFLCTPNNPTGSPVSSGLMGRILARCAEKNIWLVVDECFLELSDQGEAGGLARELMRYKNLFLLRAFTKSYAMPGLRLGYGLSADDGLMEKLTLAGQAWSVSSPAQAAGVAALGEPDYPARARALIQAERERLSDSLAALGFKVYPSAANYLLFRARGVGDLKERALARGVLLRSCANYRGLGEEYYRVAVRLREENERLVQALREVL